MPLYDFECPSGHATEAMFSFADVPASIDCPTCSVRARRRMASPALGHGSSSAMRLLDSTARSAHEPAVVSSTAPGTHTPARVTHDPRHRLLPRP